MYVILSNCRSNKITHKNLLNNVGSLTWYKPLSCGTTNSESRRTSRERTPCKMASRRSSIMALYLATLFKEGCKYMTPEENT